MLCYVPSYSKTRIPIFEAKEQYVVCLERACVGYGLLMRTSASSPFLFFICLNAVMVKKPSQKKYLGSYRVCDIEDRYSLFTK